MSFKRRHSGFSLFELIFLMIVFSVALAAVLSVFNATVMRSGDPMIRKQSMAIAESMMEEVLLMPFNIGPGNGARANFDDVRDYNGFVMNGIVGLDNIAVPGLGAYNVTIAVVNVAIGPAANALQVTVTVGGPSPEAAYVLVGYKTQY